LAKASVALGLPVITVRPFNAYDESIGRGIPTSLHKPCQKRFTLAVWKPLRYLCDGYINGFIKASETDRLGLFNLGTGREIKIGDPTQLLSKNQSFRDY
jgi:hypothetical protein